MDKVIIDAAKMTHPDFRKGSIVGALANLLVKMRNGDVVCVAQCYDSFGQLVQTKEFRDKITYITKYHKDKRLDGMKVLTRSHEGGLLIKKDVLGKREADAGDS